MSEQEQKYDEKFRPLPVAELLSNSYHFDIPSFQRGYRWERKQVNDLLDDMYALIKAKRSRAITFSR